MRLLLLLVLLLAAGPVRAQGGVAERIEDLRRTSTIRAALALDVQTRAYDVGVATEGGVVTLSGEVGTTGARERAEALARGVRGVRAVQNGLRVAGRPDVPVARAEPPPASGGSAGEEDAYESGASEGAYEPTQAAPPPARAEPEAAQPAYHTVRSGDTLYSIARRYGTTVQALQRLNRLDSSNIRLGQRLRVR